MTRKEEIEKAAFEYINSDAVNPMNTQLAFGDFINGAKWADKTMIDKVEKYLRAKIILYTLATTVDQREEWFNDFRKAMEE